MDDDLFDDDFEVPVIEMEVTDVLDLHTFPPRDVKALVLDYLDLAVEKGFTQVRIIHGKGKGVQRKMVRALVEKDPRVEAYGDPPGEAGGWGATWVRFDPDALGGSAEEL
ncbi:MAG: Smr/MutS family protein [Acidobacteriota bacterium]